MILVALKKPHLRSKRLILSTCHPRTYTYNVVPLLTYATSAMLSLAESQEPEPSQQLLKSIGLLLTASGIHFRLSLSLFLLLGFLFLGLLIRFDFLVVFPLQIGFFRLRLFTRLEETFQTALLAGFKVLGQTCGTRSYAVLIETLLLDQKLDQAVHIRRFPFEVAVRVVGLADVGLLEQEASILVGPVLGEGILVSLLVMLYHAFQVLVFTDEIQCDLWADSL